MISRTAPLLLALLTAASAAQDRSLPERPPTPDVVGTWEMVAAENVPADDALVFARLTFSADRLDAVYVFLDPDDGELSGRFEQARVQPSAGQLIVRDGRDVTVFEVTRDATLLTVHDLETGVVLRLRAADPAGALDPDLLGAWSGTRNGRPFAVRFGPTGRAEVREGVGWEEGPYVVAGPYVLLGDDPARYTFARDASGQRQLVVEADGQESVLARTP